jgi:hypothetical protein
MKLKFIIMLLVASSGCFAQKKIIKTVELIDIKFIIEEGYWLRIEGLATTIEGAKTMIEMKKIIYPFANKEGSMPISSTHFLCKNRKIRLGKQLNKGSYLLRVAIIKPTKDDNYEIVKLEERLVQI